MKMGYERIKSFKNPKKIGKRLASLYFITEYFASFLCTAVMLFILMCPESTLTDRRFKKKI